MKNFCLLISFVILFITFPTAFASGAEEGKEGSDCKGSKPVQLQSGCGSYPVDHYNSYTVTASSCPDCVEVDYESECSVKDNACIVGKKYHWDGAYCTGHVTGVVDVAESACK